MKDKEIHLFCKEHHDLFPKYDNDRFNATLCGYVRDNVTKDKDKVTCKLCIKIINKSINQ